MPEGFIEVRGHLAARLLGRLKLPAFIRLPDLESVLRRIDRRSKRNHVAVRRRLSGLLFAGGHKVPEGFRQLAQAAPFRLRALPRRRK